MKKILLILIIITVMVAGIMLGPAVVEYEGYVLIVMEHGTYQMRIFGALMTLLVACLVGWFIWWCTKRLFRILSGTQSWVWSWSSRKKKHAFTDGLLALSVGDYEVARKQLVKIEDDDFDGINLLAAAEAEIQLGDQQKARELWLYAASYPKAELAANLNLIRDLLAQNDTSAALERISQLDSKIQMTKPMLAVWAQALTQAGKYRELEALLPKWKKILGAEYQQWLQKASQGTFAEIASKEGAMQLKQNWQSLPRSARKQPAQQSAYIQQLLNQGMYADAEEALITHQKSGPNELLLPLFRQLKSPNPASAFKKLESWIKNDELNVELLSVLGELAYNAKEYSLAEKALGKAIKLGNQNHDMMLMANIKEVQNDDKQALELYKKTVINS
jgi:HemY protein